MRDVNHSYNQSQKGLRKLLELLLDNCSTCDVIVNGDFLLNIRKCDWTLALKTQAGDCKIDQIGGLPGVGTVWYHPEGVANILSLHRMAVNCRWDIDYTTKQFQESNDTGDLGFKCKTLENVELFFGPTKTGLHVMDCSKTERSKLSFVLGKKILDNGTHFGRPMHNSTAGPTGGDPLARAVEPRAGVRFADELHMNEDEGSSATDTVEESRKRFTRRDREMADKVRRLQHVSGHPAEGTMAHSVKTNGIKNNPITQRDLKVTEDMLGKCEYALKGKTVRRQPDAVEQQALVDLPQEILDHCINVEMSADVLHVNQIPFLASLSKNLHYGTINALENMRMSTLEDVLRKVLSIYRIRGFNVIMIHVDIQFKGLKDRNQLGVTFNVVSKGEHVPEMERFNRVIKERARCHYAMLPFDVLPVGCLVLTSGSATTTLLSHGDTAPFSRHPGLVNPNQS